MFTQLGYRPSLYEEEVQTRWSSQEFGVLPLSPLPPKSKLNLINGDEWMAEGRRVHPNNTYLISGHCVT